ncbi:MAG TPA: RcnB family protein [Methylophilaceae bacterium]|nr:RcnB family protein [Methylophilaceae bacterium]
MKSAFFMRAGLTTAMLTTLFIATPVFADKSDKAYKHGHQHSQRNYESHRDGYGRHNDLNVSVHFGDRERVIVREYYAERFHAGHCPPGLAKKHNGCMPPGQAKKWAIGRPLPREVIYYDLPPSVIVEIGAPPPGYKYVRIAADILLIAVGTGMVVDAIEDLSNM